MFLEVHLELFWLPCLHEVVLSSYEDLPLHTLFLIPASHDVGLCFVYQMSDVSGCGT